MGRHCAPPPGQHRAPRSSPSLGPVARRGAAVVCTTGALVFGVGGVADAQTINIPGVQNPFTGTGVTPGAVCESILTGGAFQTGLFNQSEAHAICQGQVPPAFAPGPGPSPSPTPSPTPAPPPPQQGTTQPPLFRLGGTPPQG